MTVSVAAQAVQPLLWETFIPFDDTLRCSGYVIVSDLTGDVVWLAVPQLARNLQEAVDVWNDHIRRQRHSFPSEAHA